MVVLRGLTASLRPLLQLSITVGNNSKHIAKKLKRLANIGSVNFLESFKICGMYCPIDYVTAPFIFSPHLKLPFNGSRGRRHKPAPMTSLLMRVVLKGQSPSRCFCSFQINFAKYQTYLISSATC